MKKILFVCTGNICRSPMARGIFTQLVDRSDLSNEFYVDSAGTMAWNLDNPPEMNAQLTMCKRGIDISHYRARQIEPKDISEFDCILVADEGNFHHVNNLAANADNEKIGYLMNYSNEQDILSIPDPYGKGLDYYEYVLMLIDQACIGLFQHLKDNNVKTSVLDR